MTDSSNNHERNRSVKMTEILLHVLRSTLPPELTGVLETHLEALENGNFQAILQEPLVRRLLGHEHDEKTKDIFLKDFPIWTECIFHRLGILLGKRDAVDGVSAQDTPIFRQYLFFIAGLAAIGAFIQSNVTGPPLPFSPAKVIFPFDVSSDAKSLSAIRTSLVESLGADGEAAYRLTPNVELICLADAIVTCPPIHKNIPVATWARLRVNFLHQRLLSDIAPSLQKQIYEDLSTVNELILREDLGPCKEDVGAGFLLERATVQLHHRLDKEGREDLDQATKDRHFEFALTGLLGKRTRYQRKDLSQLVVLARSAGAGQPNENSNEAPDKTTDTATTSQPKALDLNDDTLLESISFAERQESSADIKEESALPPSLRSLDPGAQPLLEPLDSIILLNLAASITNTNPNDGITREETLPYATRVLEGGSSNWQVYTQALLLRSRIEGYRSRTVERGLLQLQTLVDQVIADTAEKAIDGQQATDATVPQVTTFLPKPKEGESAPASQRLLYIYQLCSPYRWDLEAELASRWVSLGGLRSALDIYSRLEMWPEAALCYAATEREDKAARIVRRQLFHSSSGPDHDAQADEDAEEWKGPAREPPPGDAPRLYCILGDIDKDPLLYEQAWEVSNERYARAQRSLGRHWYAQHDYAKAALAYGKALKVKQLDHATWFAFGCCLLELSQFKRAVKAFSRAVQMDDTDAESWSNLAAALLHLDPKEAAEAESTDPAPVAILDDEEPSHSPLTPAIDRQKPSRDALAALKQATKHAPTNHRILSNLLTVAASLQPPSWTDVLFAQSHIIDLRGKSEGESCIDVNILTSLINHIISSAGSEGYDASKPGLARMVVKLVDEKVVPLITGSAELWQLVARLCLWRNKPSSALSAHEKAWRAVTQKPGWEYGSEGDWNGVVEATESLVSAYENLGPMEAIEGFGAGSGQLVARDWKFKARSAARGILSKGKASREDTAGWDKLKALLEELKS
jgi:tetratricopeptide (TPR) repeat protein